MAMASRSRPSKGEGSEARGTSNAGARAGFEDALVSEMLCPICLRWLVAAHASVPCGHIFCSDCLLRWLVRNSTCPCCRAEAIIAPLPCRKLDLIVDLLAREILHPDEAGERAERLGQSERATAAFRLRWQEILQQPNGAVPTHAPTPPSFTDFQAPMPSTPSLLNFVIPPALEGWSVPLALPAPPGAHGSHGSADTPHGPADSPHGPRDRPHGHLIEGSDGSIFWVRAAPALLEGRPSLFLALPAPPALAESPEVTPPPLTDSPGPAQEPPRPAADGETHLVPPNPQPWRYRPATLAGLAHLPGRGPSGAEVEADPVPLADPSPGATQEDRANRENARPRLEREQRANQGNLRPQLDGEHGGNREMPPPPGFLSRQRPQVERERGANQENARPQLERGGNREMLPPPGFLPRQRPQVERERGANQENASPQLERGGNREIPPPPPGFLPMQPRPLARVPRGGAQAMPGGSPGEGHAAGDTLPLAGVPRGVAQATLGASPSEAHTAADNPRGDNLRGDALRGPRGELGWILLRRNSPLARPQQEAGNAPIRVPPAAGSARVNILPDSQPPALGSAPQTVPTPGGPPVTGASALAHAPHTVPMPATGLGTGASASQEVSSEMSPESSTEHIVPAHPPSAPAEMSPESSTEHIPVPVHPPSAAPHTPTITPHHPGNRPLFPPSEPSSPVLHLVPFIPRLPSLAYDIQPAASIQDFVLGGGRERPASETQAQLAEPQVTQPQLPQPQVAQPQVTRPQVTPPQVTQPQLTQPEVTPRKSTSKVTGQARRLCNLAVGLAPVWLPLLLDIGMKAITGLRAAAPAPEPVTWPSPAAWEVALLAP